MVVVNEGDFVSFCDASFLVFGGVPEAVVGETAGVFAGELAEAVVGRVAEVLAYEVAEAVVGQVAEVLA